jgi:copper chaperone
MREISRTLDARMRGYITPVQTTAFISGMTCAHCVRAVFTALAGVPGIERADVSIGKAVIEHDGTVAPEDIRAAVAVAGYTVGDIKIDGRTLPIVP